MPFILGTNDEDGSLFISGYEREQHEFHSQFYPMWEQLPGAGIKFDTWMEADAYRSTLQKRTGMERRLYIWEWHPQS